MKNDATPKDAIHTTEECVARDKVVARCQASFRGCSPKKIFICKVVFLTPVQFPKRYFLNPLSCLNITLTYVLSSTNSDALTP